MSNDYPQTAPKPGGLTEAPTAVTAPIVIDGAWFRRERERIAIGRRTVARHLGIAESRIIALELRKLPVPEPWLLLVTQLGFRSPPLLSRAPEAPTRETVVADPSPAAPQPLHESAPARPNVAPSDTTDSAVPATRSEQATAEPEKMPPLPELPRGGWLRERRYALDLLMPGISRALQAPVDEIRTVETNNLPVPPSWLPALRSLKFYQASEGDRTVSQRRLLTGDWLQRMRQEKRLSVGVLSANMGVGERTLQRVEARRLPLSPEWLPSLRQLGFPVPETSSPSSAPAKKAAPVSSSSSSPPSGRKHLSGAWLRRHRERLGLMQKTLSEQLGISQSTLCHLEREDRSINPQWLSVLKKLGFPMRADAAPPAATKRSSSAPSLPPQDRAPQKPLTGAWLRKHRERMGLMQKTVSEQLGISQAVLCHVERKDKTIPARWVPILKKVGFPVPAPSSPPTPPSPLTGAWLRRHRKRLRLFIRHICDQLSITPELLRSAEEARKAMLPTEWLPALKKLGFPVPDHVALPAGAPTKAPALPASPLPDGAWLRAERERLGLSRKQLARRLHKKEGTLRPVENGSSPLPTGWLPTLQRLGFRLPPNAPPKKRPTPADPPKKSAESRPPVEKQALAAPPPADRPASPSPTRADELRAMVEMVVSYRLKLGRFSGQSAADLLTSIGNDLRQAGLEKAIPFEQIEAAFRSLLSL